MDWARRPDCSQVTSKKRGGVQFERLGHLDEFDDVHAPLAVFILGDEGLGAVESASENLLRHAGALTGRLEHVDKQDLLGRPEGLAHASGGREATQAE